MNAYLMILLRLVHVLCGILWGGTAVFYLFFIKPSVKAIGPAAPKFMQSLTQRQRLPLFMSLASLLTVLSGVVLFTFSSGFFNLGWISSGPGLGFTIGSLSGLVPFLVGTFGIGPISGKIGALGQQIAAAGGPPSEEQTGRMHALEARLSRLETIDIIFLLIAMVAMGTARYWIF